MQWLVVKIAALETFVLQPTQRPKNEHRTARN